MDVHGPGYSATGSLTGARTLEHGAWHDGFHVYAVEWSAGSIEFLVDPGLDRVPGRRRHVRELVPGNVPVGGQWVFDQPFS